MTITAISPLLSMSDVVYRYPTGVQALGGVNLELKKGEILSIVGPSGCGKSTILSLIAGLATPTGGAMHWNAAEAEQHKQRRNLAMVFQRDTLFPWQSVEKNIQFGMNCVGVPKDEQRTRTEELLKLGNLESFGKAFPRELSGGMRRRVALLMGLAVQPSVLLLDEPFSALDEPTRVELSGDVTRLAYDAGVSVVLVTHDLGEAISVSDRILVMTNRPARVRVEVKTDFGHERDVVAVRESPEYSELYTTLWHELWTSIREKNADE